MEEHDGVKEHKNKQILVEIKSAKESARKQLRRIKLMAICHEQQSAAAAKSSAQIRILLEALAKRKKQIHILQSEKFSNELTIHKLKAELQVAKGQICIQNEGDHYCG